MAPTTLLQKDLMGNILELKDLSRFGDDPARKTEAVFRVESQNIGNLPQWGTTAKSQQVANRAKHGTADVQLWQEIGLCWQKLNKWDQWHARTRGAHLHSHFEYNKTEADVSLPLQPGGVAVIGGPNRPWPLGRNACGRNRRKTRVLHLCLPTLQKCLGRHDNCVRTASSVLWKECSGTQTTHAGRLEAIHRGTHLPW